MTSCGLADATRAIGSKSGMRFLVSFGLVVASAACAGHRAPETAAQESVPHISWEFSVERDSRSVCDSTTPKSCALRASNAKSPSRVTVHLFLHSGAAEVKYSGTLRMPFLQETGLPSDFKMTVPAGSKPVGRTLSGSVVEKPGTYEMEISLDAVMGADSKPIRIEERVPVRVE